MKHVVSSILAVVCILLGSAVAK